MFALPHVYLLQLFNFKRYFHFFILIKFTSNIWLTFNEHLNKKLKQTKINTIFLFVYYIHFFLSETKININLSWKVLILSTYFQQMIIESTERAFPKACQQGGGGHSNRPIRERGSLISRPIRWSFLDKGRGLKETIKGSNEE